METAHEVLLALTERYAFREVAALVALGADGERLSSRDAAHVQALCTFGQRLMDMDAEDFGRADPTERASLDPSIADRDEADAVPADLLARSLACRMPQTPAERHRGALGSLVPAYRLLLEVIDARWRRREMAALVAALHIASEYAPLLVWERVLGHAGDPARMAGSVGGPGSAWGDFDDRDCPHTKPDKSAAHRALTVADEPASGWRAYLDRQHSNAAHAIGVCAAECRRPCTVLTRLSKEDIQIVGVGCRLAFALTDSALVRLRHAAPVGHGFGVPSPPEVLAAWDRTRRSLSRVADAELADDGFPLPGLTGVFARMAGRRMTPDTLLGDTAAAISAAIRSDGPK